MRWAWRLLERRRGLTPEEAQFVAKGALRVLVEARRGALVHARRERAVKRALLLGLRAGDDRARAAWVARALRLLAPFEESAPPRRRLPPQDDEKDPRLGHLFWGRRVRLDGRPSGGETVPFTEEAVRGYLDDAIRYWRNVKVQTDDEAPGAEARRTMASHYIDAFQSMRTSLFGELLPPEKVPGEADGTP